MTPWLGVPIPLVRPAAVVADAEFKQKAFSMVPSINLGWEI